MDSRAKFVKPSSSTEGFFQEIPKIYNQFEDDHVLRRTFQLVFPPSIQASAATQLQDFASAVLTPQIFGWISDAESNPPTFSSHDLLGRPRSVLRTSEGWRQLQAFGISHGIWTTAYDSEPNRTSNGEASQYGECARTFQFLKYHIWSGSCAITTCPAAMADGAASLLGAHLAKKDLESKTQRIFSVARQRLLSKDPKFAWTSGQWMTERSGGSDVTGTETLATRVDDDSETKSLDSNGDPLGPWSISGFKWFSSATDSQMTILLARTNVNEISAFYAPLYLLPNNKDELPQLNGIKISRLKPKVGTRPLPTAELELSDMRAYMLGKPGDGTRELATVLTITRVHTAVSALGLWGRGLGIARAYSRVRKVARGKLLINMPAHISRLADLTVQYAGNMALGFFTVHCLAVSTSSSHKQLSSLVHSAKEAIPLLRLLTPICKAINSTAACIGLRECMECLGGIGYLEDPATPELNVARLLRDCLVLPIWEGTTDVLAADVARVLTSKSGSVVKGAFKNWVGRLVASWKSNWEKNAATVVENQWQAWETLVDGLERDELCFRGKDIMERLAWIVSAVVLVEDARRDGDPVASEIAQRWIATKSEKDKRQWQEIVIWDKKVVFRTLDNESKMARI